MGHVGVDPGWDGLCVDFHPELTRVWSEPLGLDHRTLKKLIRLDFTPSLVRASCDLSGWFQLGRKGARRQVSER